ncbi:MAG: GAF domain-containing protein [Desulfobacterales bacterium]|nr:GAF domain-containing protein [Desulfobacterales bacterium]MDH3876685.1 GAF domain-containing protein [Desulfobacterales bacterium]
MANPSTPTGILDPDFLQSVVRQASYQCRADGSCFYLWESDKERISLVATHNLQHVPWDEGLPGRVMSSRETVTEICPNGSVSLAAPLIWQDSVRGVLVVSDGNGKRVFRERDAALLQSLADMTASMAQQNERLARMTTQFRALHAIDVALTSSLELESVLDMILEKAAELVGAEHGSLRQLDTESGKLVLRAHYGDGWTPEKLAYTPRIGQGIARWVAENRRPYLSPDVRDDPLNVVLFEDMRSSISIPLQYGREDPGKPDSLLGVLLLESSRVAAFDQQDVELLEALAQEAVIAIQNASQHRKLLSEQEKRLAAEKWAIMGQAATALAHRINNLMGIVPVSAREALRSLTKLEMADSERLWIEANLERIERNAQFILKLSEALFRPFKDSGPAARQDVNHLLDEALEAADLPDEIEVSQTFEKKLPLVDCSLLLVDIFLELITNARKAMEDREQRRLHLSTHSDQDDAGFWVIVEIKDTGRGITSEQMRHLWNMFKQSEDGLGFGLWWLRTFIERQGGSIKCHSEPDKGSVFVVRLPAATGQQSSM